MRKQQSKREVDHSEALKKFGQRLREYRVANGYSNYEQFAFSINMNRTQYGRYENGANINLTTILTLAKEFGVEPHELLIGITDKE